MLIPEPAAGPAPEPAPEPAPAAAEPQDAGAGEPDREPALDEATVARRDAEADAMTAEAIARPAAEALSPWEARKLGCQPYSPGIVHSKAYRDCRGATGLDVDLAAGLLLHEAQQAYWGGLREWKDAGRPETGLADYQLKNDHLQPPAAVAASAR